MAAQIVDAQFVRSHIGKLPIIDVRSAELYDEGHIPTTINVCVADFDRYGAEEADEFSKECRRHAFTEECPIIMYCQVGRHAKQACDLLEAEGYQHLYLYLGSFDDWASDPENPIEK